MSVTSLGSYQFESRDALERYKGRQLLYINWEMHRMFSRPFVLALDPATKFSVLLEKYIPDAYSFHPDFAHIDWKAVTWRNSNVEFRPDPDKSLAQNGIGHKDFLRFTTPGLNGLNGTGY